MDSIPYDMKFLKTHEWAKKDGSLIIVGVTDYAVEQLNREIVYVELPEVGCLLKKEESFGLIDAVKAASDLYAPMSGKVVETNTEAMVNAAIVGEYPQNTGWLIKIDPSNPAEWDDLLSPAKYKALIESGEAH
ncbi:MAG: glycine cleavage system H protein [bacterium]|nr:glycine cleavage system protein H [Candidatus Sumerlaeota bacterium]